MCPHVHRLSVSLDAATSIISILQLGHTLGLRMTDFDCPALRLLGSTSPTPPTRSTNRSEDRHTCGTSSARSGGTSGPLNMAFEDEERPFISPDRQDQRDPDL